MRIVALEGKMRFVSDWDHVSFMRVEIKLCVSATFLPLRLYPNR